MHERGDAREDSAIAGGVLVLPLLGMAMVLAPASLLVTAACVVLGVLLVWIALRATRPVLTGVLADPERAV